MCFGLGRWWAFWQKFTRRYRRPPRFKDLTWQLVSASSCLQQHVKVWFTVYINWVKSEPHEEIISSVMTCRFAYFQFLLQFERNDRLKFVILCFNSAFLESTALQFQYNQQRLANNIVKIFTCLVLVDSYLFCLLIFQNLVFKISLLLLMQTYWVIELQSLTAKAYQFRVVTLCFYCRQ